MDEHFLRAVTELGDARRITAHCDIYSQGGMKLVAAGVHITSELYDRLVKHKLLAPLEKTLTTENALAPQGLLDDMHELLQSNGKLRKIAGLLDMELLEGQLLTVLLPPPLAFKLTVAREKYPKIYRHSLLLMLVSVYLARCDGMAARDQALVAMAALFHDIGLLHIDPKLLEASHVMNDAERRHLYAHPLTAYLLLCEFPDIHRDVANAVLEHHERADGSGYPRGLHGDKISRAGQILAVAELAAKAFDADQASVPWEKLEVMLKLNSRHYGQGLIGHLNILRNDAAEEVLPGVENPGHLFAQAALVAELFDNFNHHSNPACHDKMFELAQTRLAALMLELFEAGFDPRNPADMMQRFIDDAGCMQEHVPLLNEALWQFKSLVLEISRHLGEGKPPDRIARPWLEEMKQSLLAAAVPMPTEAPPSE